MKKNVISIEGVMSKINEDYTSQQECDDLIDDILKLIEDRGFAFGGNYFLITEEKYIKGLEEDENPN